MAGLDQGHDDADVGHVPGVVRGCDLCFSLSGEARLRLNLTH